jgi:pilus assembly protein CpaE
MAEGRRQAGRGAGESGQASVELIAVVPGLVLAGLLCLQLLATGYSLSLADGAAEAGAIAIAAGLPAEPAVQAALPGWADRRVELERDGGRLTVRLRPPAAIEAVGRALEVSSSAWARPPQEAS